jgi:hypothetical protein
MSDEFDALVERCDRLMEGRIEYTRAEEGEPRRGFVWAVWEAPDSETWEPNEAAFERVARRSLSDFGWTFAQLERLDWFVPDTSAAYRLALAVEALEVEDPAFGEAFEWVDEPQTIDPEETEALQDALDGRTLVYATTDEKDVGGYVVAFSDEIVLMHHVDLDVMSLNGYCAISRPDFFRLVSVEEEFSLDEGEKHFASSALEALGIEPTNPGAPLDTWEAFLRWAGRLGPLAIVERGQGRRGIGTLVAVDDGTLVVNGISAEGRWVGEFRHAIADIARVDFLDGYLRALERVAGHAK